MRTAFIETLEELALRDKNIFLLNGDLGFSVLENFIKKFPERSLNMGVAEANMIGAAAGLALSGKTVFVYSIVPFVTARVFEQVRNDAGLQKANIKIVGVGGGLTYGQLGPTHHSIEDIAIMRTIPGMTVVAPGDPIETRLATKALAQMKGPAYLRICKKGDLVVHAKVPAFALGKGIVVERGKHIALIATGNMLPTAIEVARICKEKGMPMTIVSMHTIKPLDVSLMKKLAASHKAIFTLEEHSIIGGLGGAVAETLMEERMRPAVFHRFGVADTATLLAGSHDYLRGVHNLIPQSIAIEIAKRFKKS